MPTRRRFFGGALGGLAALVVTPKVAGVPVVELEPEQLSGYEIQQLMRDTRERGEVVPKDLVITAYSGHTTIVTISKELP